MNKFSKILKAAAVFTVSALVLAACAGDREIESFRIVGPEPEFAASSPSMKVRAPSWAAG